MVRWLNASMACIAWTGPKQLILKNVWTSNYLYLNVPLWFWFTNQAGKTHTHTHTITIIWHYKIIFHGYIKEKYERKEEKRRRKMEIKSKLDQWLYAFWLVVWILLGLKGRCLNFSDINPSLSAGLRAYAFLSFESALPLSLFFIFLFHIQS